MSDNPIESGPSSNAVPTQDSPDKSPGTPPPTSKIPVLPQDCAKESPKRAAINGTWPYPDDTSTARQGRRHSLSMTTTAVNRDRLPVTASTFSAPENSSSSSRPPPWAEGRVAPSGRSSLGPKEPDTPTMSLGHGATLLLSRGRVSQADLSPVNVPVPTLAAQVATLEARVATYEGQAADLAAVRAERDQLTTRVNTLNTDLESARSALAAKEQESSAQTTDLAAANAQVAALTAKVAALEARVAAHDVQNALAVFTAVRGVDDSLTGRVASLEAALNLATNRVVSLQAVRESGHPALAANEQDDVAANASATDTAADTAAKLEAHMYKTNISLDNLPIIVKGLKRCSDYATECAQRATAWAQRAEERAIRAEERAQRAEERVQRLEERTQRTEERVQSAEERAQRATECAQRTKEKFAEGERKIGEMGRVIQGLEETNKELVIAVTKLGDNDSETE